MSVHLLGRVVDGVQAVYDEFIPDAEFKSLAINGLPKGWFDFHLEDNETVENSDRVRRLAKLAKIVSCNKGEYSSEHAEHGASVWGGAATEFSTPMADVRVSFRQAKDQDTSHAVLDQVAPPTVPTNERTYIDKLVTGLLLAFPGLPKATAHAHAHSWVRLQPEYIIVDNFLGGVHEQKFIEVGK